MCCWATIGISGLYAQGQSLTGELTNDPSKTVEKYVQLDQQGVRLQALSAVALTPYVSWEDEPTWGQVVVIDHMKVHREVREWTIISPTEVIIPVTFQVLGVMQWNTATFLAEPGTEIIRVRVKAIDNRWRIVAPQFPPHVKRKRLMDFVRLSWLDETSPPKKDRLHHLLNALMDKP